MASADLIIAQAALVYDRAWALATQKANAADARIATAINLAGQGFTAPVLSQRPDRAEPDEPLFPDMSSDLARANALSARLDLLTDSLANDFYSFLQTNFPPSLAEFDVVLQDLPALVGLDAQPLYDRLVDRALREATRNESEALGLWASRGYALPPGAAVAQVNRIRQETRDRISEASRDATVAQTATEVENRRTLLSAYVQQNGQAIQLATARIDAAIRVRVEGVRAAGEYIRALALPLQLSTQLTTEVLQAKTTLTNAMTAVYSAQISALTALSNVDLTKTEFELRVQQQLADLRLRSSEQQVNAAIAAAQSAAVQAGAALNTLHSNFGANASANVDAE